MEADNQQSKKQRSLTSKEWTNCHRRMKAWLHETKRWASDFETSIPPLSETIDAHNENKPVPNYESLVIAGTYFILAAGTTYYHALELVQTKMGVKPANKWFRDRRDRSEALQLLYVQRNLLTHGAYRDIVDQEFTFLFTTGPDKTLDEALKEAESNPGKKIPTGFALKIQWWNKNTDEKIDIVKWHKDIIDELTEITSEIPSERP